MDNKTKNVLQYDSLEYKNGNIISVRVIDPSNTNNTIKDNIINICTKRIDDILNTNQSFNIIYKIELSIDVYCSENETGEDTTSMGYMATVEIDSNTVKNVFNILDEIAKDIREECFLNNPEFNIDLNVHVDLNNKEDQGDKDNE